MDRISEILDGLINRTEEGKLTWRVTTDPDIFVTSVDTIVVSVSSDSIGGKSPHHHMLIKDFERRTSRVLHTPYSEAPDPEHDATPEQAQQLSRLFTLARGSALKADLTLEQLAKSLANIS